MNDSLLFFGDSLKALDNDGKVGGYAVRFTSAMQKDLSGEYFTAKTYLGAHQGDGVDVLFHHGQPLPVKASLTAEQKTAFQGFTDHIFAPVKTKRDAVGLWAETVLDLADEYEKAVFGLVKAGKIGWSSGTAGHTAKKKSDGEITRWPIIEISLTPTPCEKLNRTYPIKSLDGIKFVSISEDDDEPSATIPSKPTGLAAKLNQHIDDLVDDKGRDKESIIRLMAKQASIKNADVEAMLANETKPTDANLKAFARVLQIDYSVLKSATRRDHLQTIKGMFEEELAEKTPSRWELDSVYCCVIKKLANAASGAAIAGLEFDWQGKVAEATAEYTKLLEQQAVAQIQDWIAEGEDEEFYLKAILDGAESLKSLSTSDLDTHSQFTVSVLRGISNRFRGNHEGRMKAGRVLSEKNRQRITDLMGQMDAVKSEFQKLLDESMPMASEAEKRAAVIKHLAIRQRHRELTMGV